MSISEEGVVEWLSSTALLLRGVEDDEAVDEDAGEIGLRAIVSIDVVRLGTSASWRRQKLKSLVFPKSQLFLIRNRLVKPFTITTASL